MADFFVNCFLWVCAIYGIIEIIKNIIYIKSFNCISTDGIHIIVAVKNQENKIEGFLRTLNFRLLYGKEDNINDIIVLDLNSRDKTKQIVENYSKDYSNIKIVDWTEFKKLFESEIF